MSGMTWLHLSDWHQRGKDFDRRVVRDALMEDIRERDKISEDLAQLDLIFFTGDIAFSGKTEEYEAALEYLFKPLLEASGLGEGGWNQILTVPGNHDIDRGLLNKLQSEIILSLDSPKAVNESLGNSWKRNALLSLFPGYSAFVSKYLGVDVGQMNTESAYSYARKFEFGGKKIGIIGLNSTWFSARYTDAKGEVYDYGKLIMGEPQVYDRLADLGKVDVVIALMHHPFSWLSDFDRDAVEERLTRYCHFILHGHQHLPRVNVTSSTLGDVIVIPGGACYDRRHAENPRYTNSYNFVHLDFNTGQGVAYLRRWSEQQGIWIDDTELFNDGRFRFTLPKAEGLLSALKQEARQKLISRFTPTLRRRFCDEIDLSIKHTLENHNGVKLVRHDVLHKIQISPGEEETFVIETFSDGRVVRLVEAGKVNIEPYELSYFKVGGKASGASEVQKSRIFFTAELDEGKVLIEYKYRLYLKPDDLYVLRLGRFTKNFRLRFKTDNNLEYDFAPLGGLRPAELRKHDFFESYEMEISDLCFPDQGYLIRWFLPDQDDITPPEATSPPSTDI
jgi:predicted phosphodiesterase